MKDILAFDLPKQKSSIIKVLGVGGGGSNAVTHMFKQGIKGVDFIICNTDSQAMDTSPIPNKIQLGESGLGAGAIPDVGRDSAERKAEEIKGILNNTTKMLFITAGMGGGTGTGAAPVIAKIAREMGILTVAIVTIPFMFEGRKRRLQAEKGIEELRKQVDTLLIISNEKLREIHGNLKLSEAFGRADDILTIAAKGIAEIITVTGYINVDFEDVKTVMKDSGTAIMGSAIAEGPDRARVAVEHAMSSPLLNDNKIIGASNILLYVTSGKDEITFDEVTEITDYIQREAGQSAEIIWGNGYDESLGEKISITLIATGFEAPEVIDQSAFNKEKKKTIFNLNATIPDETEKPVEIVPVEIRRFEAEKPEKIHIPEPSIVEEPAEIFSFELKAVEPVAEITKAPEVEEITEITLIRREKPAEAKTNSGYELTNHSNEIVLFDASEEPEKPVNHENTHLPKVEVYSKSTTNNGGLRISRTVGSFQRITETPKELNTQHNQEAEMEKKADERVRKLREMSLKLDVPGDLEAIESVPAYKRKNVELNQVAPSSESGFARFSLADETEEKPAIRNNENSFLHNKPD
jgi:cell division protein FtsZ